MEYELTSEIFEKKFGELELEVIFQDANARIVCFRIKSNGEALEYSIVHFHKAGVEKFGEFHQKVVDGNSLGIVVRGSGIPHKRIETERMLVSIPPEAVPIFKTDSSNCVSKKISYEILGEPYADITEFYNPKYVSI